LDFVLEDKRIKKCFQVGPSFLNIYHVILNMKS
jgi:hypothetical protein